jgi:hypothetical protein
MAPTQRSPFYRRLFLYTSVLVRLGWKSIVFWIATVYSIYAATVPAADQEALLKVIHVDPNHRLAIWGFGLALFFLDAGFKAWDDAEHDGPHGELARAQTALAREQLQDLRNKRKRDAESDLKRKLRRISGDLRPGTDDDDPDDL